MKTCFRLLLERQTLISSTWKNSSALLSSFSACQFMFCTFSSIFLLNMGTTALHLSLLSGNFYTLIVGILLFNYKVLFLQINFINISITQFSVPCLILPVIYIVNDWSLYLLHQKNVDKAREKWVDIYWRL